MKKDDSFSNAKYIIMETSKNLSMYYSPPKKGILGKYHIIHYNIYRKGIYSCINEVNLQHKRMIFTGLI